MTKAKKIFINICLVFVIAIVWQIGAKLTSPIFIPSPFKVFDSFIVMITSGQLWIAMRYSFQRITISTLLSSVLSIFIGYFMKISNEFYTFFNPIIKAMRFLPVTAFYPILTIWFGIGEEMKIAFLFIATFVYMLPSVLIALDEVDKDVIEAASVEGANKSQTILKIILPIAAPSIAQSFAMMYGIGYTYIAVAEQTNAKNGLGYLIYTSSARGLMHMTFVGIITIIIISVVFDAITTMLIKRIFKWKFS